MLDWYYHHYLKPQLWEQSKDNHEKAHRLMIEKLQRLERRPWLCRWLRRMYDASNKWTRTDVMGLPFVNPIILAAGIDKDCKLWNALSILGPGGIDHGGVVPLRQEGNQEPRLYRYPDKHEIVNSQGFPSDGREVVHDRVSQLPRSAVLRGCNLGKNKDTPLERTVNDMCLTMEALYPYFDWFTVNVSSPNTPGLRNVQAEGYLTPLLGAIMALSQRLKDKHRLYFPRRVRVKLSPDLPDDQLKHLLDICILKNVDCVVLGNTRADNLPDGRPAGRSGPSLYPRTLEMTKLAAPILHEHGCYLSACGGIDTVDKALELLEAGADTIETLTTLFYDGPGQVRRLVKGITPFLKKRKRAQQAAS